MTLKKRLLVTISMMALTVVMLMVGVWALKSTNFTVGGSIKFTAKGIQATISKGVLSETGSWKNASDAETKMPGFTITTDHSQSDVDTAMSEWKNLDLLFNENGDDVTIKFTITNNSGKDDQIIKVNVTVNDGTLNNATVGINTETVYIKSGDANKQEFVITFTVTEKTANASVTGFSLNFAMELTNEAPVDITNGHPYLTFSEPDTTNKTIGVTGFNKSVTEVEIPTNVIKNGQIYDVISINSGVFYNCTNLTSVIIGESVASIGEAVFNSCSGLTSVTIGNSVTSIGGYAFQGCSSLTNITIPDGVTSIGYEAFSACKGLISVLIPDSVKEIGISAFYKCSSLASVTIGSGIKTISASAFYNCTSLASVTIGSGVTYIGLSSFSDCTSLASITIPDAVTGISDHAFQNCIGLKSIILPVDLPTINIEAFSGCAALTDVYYKGSEEQWNEYDVEFLKGFDSLTIHYNYTGN